MTKDVDPKETRKALRKLRRTAKDAEAAGVMGDWEDEFVASVEERLEQYGSAFQDPHKGSRDAALSIKQQQVLARMRAEARKKARAERRAEMEKASGVADTPDEETVDTPRRGRRTSLSSKKKPSFGRPQKGFQRRQPASPIAEEPEDMEPPPQAISEASSQVPGNDTVVPLRQAAPERPPQQPAAPTPATEESRSNVVSFKAAKRAKKG